MKLNRLPSVLSPRAALALVAACTSLAASAAADVAASSPAASAASVAPPPARAIERCESSLVETLHEMRGTARDGVRFSPTRTLPPTSAHVIEVSGEGQYKSRQGGAVPFRWNCTFDSKSDGTSGVVFRETGPAPATATRADWQPDLTNLSPQNCESAVAAILKQKHPRVGRIVFDADTRTLQPEARGRLGLAGQGAVQRAPGMNAAPFRYECEFEPGSGRLLQARAAD